jgi:hypothetical protein
MNSVLAVALLLAVPLVVAMPKFLAEDTRGKKTA